MFGCIYRSVRVCFMHHNNISSEMCFSLVFSSSSSSSFVRVSPMIRSYFVFGGRRVICIVCVFDAFICWLLLHMASFSHRAGDWMIAMRVPKGTQISRIKNHTFYVRLSFFVFLLLLFCFVLLLLHRCSSSCSPFVST